MSTVAAVRVAATSYVFARDVPPFARGAGRPAWSVTLADEDGAEGCGEAVGWPGRLPLPDEAAMAAAATRLRGLPLDDEGLAVFLGRLDGSGRNEAIHPGAQGAHFHPGAPLHPGAAWAAWVGLARLVAARTGESLADVFAHAFAHAFPHAVTTSGGSADVAGSDVEVSGLVLDLVLAQVGQGPLAAEPPPPGRVVKVKVRRAADAAALASLARDREPGTLRLDGNHALSLDDAFTLADVAGGALDFLEEPVPPAALPAFGARAPLALDESLAGATLDEARRLVDATRARALVLKPAALGPARTLALAALAHERGLAVVVSSLYEGARGLRALAALQAALAPDVAAGLGTGRYLVGQDELVVVEGRARLAWGDA